MLSSLIIYEHSYLFLRCKSKAGHYFINIKDHCCSHGTRFTKEEMILLLLSFDLIQSEHRHLMG